MRKVMLVVVAVLAAGSAQAAEQGQYGAALRLIVTQAAEGRCPVEMMAEPLLSACRDQMPAMKPALAAQGTVERVSFVRAEQEGDARVETYAVNYAGGRAMIWSIGNRKDGKFTTAYTLGD